MRDKKLEVLCVVLMSFFLVTMVPTLWAQEKVVLTTEKLTENLYCLVGPGGNMAVLKANNSALVVDSKFAKTTSEVMKAIKEINDAPIKYLINTHYHRDHTGGNSRISESGVIVSHTNCRSSILKPLKPEEQNAIKTEPWFSYTKELTLNLDQEVIRLLHFGAGHTSGDTIVVFETQKVVHLGDLLFHGMAPYIDVEDGSDTENWITTLQTIAEKYAEYKVVPGHGPICDMKAVHDFVKYFTYLREQTAQAIKMGKSRAETIEFVKVDQFGDIKDVGDFLTKKKNVGWIYDEMMNK